MMARWVHIFHTRQMFWVAAELVGVGFIWIIEESGNNYSSSYIAFLFNVSNQFCSFLLEIRKHVRILRQFFIFYLFACLHGHESSQNARLSIFQILAPLPRPLHTLLPLTVREKYGIRFWLPRYTCIVNTSTTMCTLWSPRYFIPIYS